MWIDLYKRKRANILHFFVFGWGAIGIAIVTFYPRILNAISWFVGVATWSDLIVYMSVIVLFYFYIILYNKTTTQDMKITSLARDNAVFHAIGVLNTTTSIVFVVPSYNESEIALKVIQKILSAGYGVVLVDDWSSNNTFTDAIKKFEKSNFVAIKHPLNMWQGAALQTWATYILSYARFVEYVVHFDADWQHRLQDIAVFKKAFKNNPNLDIVLWSRFLWKAVNIPMSKKIWLKFWSTLFTWLFSGIRLTDPHNWYRMIKTSILPQLTITMNRMAHASELVDIIYAKKLTYQEVPITIIYSAYSIAKWQKISNALGIVRNLLYKKFFYR